MEPETLNLKPGLFTGDANEAEARVYASLSREGLPPDARLAGELVGPYCRYSQTLPARVGFVDRGLGETLLAEAIVPDPCFWTPELPFTYEVELHVEPAGSAAQANRPASTARQTFGIRRLGAWQRSIYLDAKRFVIRGVFRPAIDDATWLEARNHAAALLTTDPSESLCLEATEAGVLLAVDFTDTSQSPGGTRSRTTARGSAETLTDALVRLAHWPAVAVIVLDADVPQTNDLRAAARNTLLAQRVVANQPFRAAPWAKCILWQIDSQHVPGQALDTDLPVIVYRPAGRQATIQAARAACDRLQAELALLGDFAGYFT